MGYKQKSSFVSVKDTENTLLCTLCQKQKAFNNEKYRILFNEMSDMTAEQECEIFPCLAKMFEFLAQALTMSPATL